MLDDLRDAGRQACRSLRRRPGFAGAVVLTLALGIGANEALFSVVYGVLFRPLDYADADRLITVTARRTFSGRPAPVPSSFSVPDLATWQQLGSGFESVAIAARGEALLSAAEGHEIVSVATVSGSFFQTMNGRLFRGRALAPADDPFPFVVVSHTLWRRTFGDSGGLEGARVALDGHQYTVVGIVDDSFEPPGPDIDVWRTIGMARTIDPSISGSRSGGFHVFARLKPSTTRAQAQSQADAVSRVLDAQLKSTVVPLREFLLPPGTKATLLVLWASVGLLLAVSCGNVVNLFFARTTGQSREVAVRRALGVSRGRLALQAAAESLILTGVSALAGLLFAAELPRILRTVAPTIIPRLAFVRVDGPVLAFSTVLAASVACVIGIVTTRRPADSALLLRTTGYNATTGRHTRRVRSAIVSVEVALSVVLLVGGSLLGRSLERLLTVDLGVTSEPVTAARVELSFGHSPPLAAQRTAIDRILEDVRSLPGVAASGAGASLPPNLAMLRFTLRELDEAPGRPTNYLVDAVSATPGYFSALGTRLRQGRVFTNDDDARHSDVMVVTVTTAHQMFGSEPAVGKVLRLPLLTDHGVGNGPVTVVGVIDDVRYSGLDVAPNGVIFRPFSQQPWPSMFVVARTAADDPQFAASLRRTIANADPDATVRSVETLGSLVADAAAQPRLRAFVLIALAVLTAGLVAIGLHGVMALAFSQRVREIAIRLALGASRGDILALILGETASVAGVGVVGGLVAAVALARTIRGLLFGIVPIDIWSFAGAVVAITVVTFAAVTVPAHRATRVDPAVALRAE